MTSPRVARTREELLDNRFDLADQYGGETAVVMTMGALHDGHVALVRQARELVDDKGVVLVTTSSTPCSSAQARTSTGTHARSTRTWPICAHEGVDLVFAPGEGEMYPDGRLQVTVAPGPLAGGSRARADRGISRVSSTVVAKPPNLSVSSVAVFGEKDYQQLALIRRMVRDLDLGVEVVGVPTVREADGLALSSRNRFLDPAQRQAAAEVSRALRAGAAAGADGALAVREAASESWKRSPALTWITWNFAERTCSQAPAQGQQGCSLPRGWVQLVSSTTCPCCWARKGRAREPAVALAAGGRCAWLGRPGRCRRRRGRRTVFSVPGVDLFLQVGSALEQGAVPRAEIVHDVREAGPEIMGVDSGPRNHLFDHEIMQLAGDMQASDLDAIGHSTHLQGRNCQSNSRPLIMQCREGQFVERPIGRVGGSQRR